MSIDLKQLREAVVTYQSEFWPVMSVETSRMAALIDRLESAERDRDAAKTRGALLSPLAIGSAKRIDELIAERNSLFETLTAVVHAAGGRVCVGANSLIRVKSLELTCHEDPGEFHTVWSVSKKDLE